jgi:predicted GNAT family acetyltransferase
MDGMNTLYINEHSSAEVVANHELPTHLKDVRELVRVWTDSEFRKQGFATELLKTVCNDADIEGVVLMLNAKPFSTGGLNDLAPWYQRFGFMTIQKKPHLMARMPAVYKTRFNSVAGAVSELVGG